VPVRGKTGSADCGKTLSVTLITQSNIDSIASCTTIYGPLAIILQAPSDRLISPPGAFTLPLNLETIGGGFSIIRYGTYPTTNIIAPNLKTIGYGNETDVDPDVTIYGGTYQLFVSCTYCSCRKLLLLELYCSTCL